MPDLNAQYRQIFQTIDQLLWDNANATYNINRTRTPKLAILQEDAKKIISAYIDAKADMISRLIRTADFARYPLPARSIPAPTQGELTHIVSSILLAHAACEEPHDPLK